MEYRIIYGTNVIEVEEEINTLMEEGFSPYEGLCITSNRDIVMYSQAMIKYSARKKPMTKEEVNREIVKRVYQQE